MDIVLMKHQEQALEQLRSSGGRKLLNLCPGAGKTLTAITYLKEINAKNVLIICPASVLSVWSDECWKWEAPIPLSFSGSAKKRDECLSAFHAAEGSSWMVCGYEMFLRESKRLAQISWDAIVFDESQRIKSPMAKVSKVARAFAKKAKVAILLSGTPLKNGWGDLWNQVETVSSGALYGNWYVFRNMHAVMPIPGVPAIKGWRDVETIKEKVKPHIFSIDKEEIQKNLPPMTMTDVHVFLSPRERKQYDKIRDEMLMEIEGEDVSIVNALAQLTKLRQCANGLSAFGEPVSAKLEALRDLLEPLEGEKVIIFTEYASYAEFLGKELKCPVIKGSVDTDSRKAIFDEWKVRGTLLVGTSAMSTGLNLQDAHYIVQMDLPWTRADEEQRIGRAWRTGQKNPVTVYNLMARDTVDWIIRRAIHSKGSMMAELAESTLADMV